MTLITWNQTMSVRVAELDGQHQALIAMINELTEAIKKGHGRAATDRIVQGLVAYAKVHFQTEEKYFQQFGFAQAAGHIQEHAAFTQKLSDFEAGTTKGQMSLSIQLLQFLGDWLINHILKTDKAYSDFFHEKGLR
jgi:hemerythrin-like metal-binding protein